MPIAPTRPILPRRRVLRGRPFTRVWFWTVTLAETAGFAVPAGVGALTADAGPAIVVPALLAAGAVEGAALGWGQAAVLRHALPALSRRRWVLATAGAAVLACLIGLVPSAVADRTAGWPAALRVVAAALLRCGLLGSISTAQWWVLRQHVAHAARWVPATAVAWTVGLGVFLGFTMPLWRPGQDIAVTVAIGVTGGLLMAATTAAITGMTMRRLLPSEMPSQGHAVTACTARPRDGASRAAPSRGSHGRVR
jgi:hypothetical protein